MPDANHTTPNKTARARESWILFVAVMIAFAAAFFFIGRYSATRTGLGKERPSSASKLDTAVARERKMPVADSAPNVAAKAERAIPPIGKGHDVAGRSLTYNVVGMDSSEGYTGPGGEVKPVGVFLVVAVKITNSGVAAAVPLPSHIRIVDLDDYAYPPSGKGLRVCEATGRTFALCREIEPGGSMSGVIVFDVPTVKNSYRLELLDDCAEGKKLAEIYL